MRSLLTSAAISLAFTLFLTPVFLRWFRKWGWGQVIRTPENVHNPSHGAKRGTPTMGGTIFILGTIVGYLIGSFAGKNPPTMSGLLVLWMMGFGVVGFIDDYMKVRHQNSLGLSGWRKIAGQVIVAVPFAIVALNFPTPSGRRPPRDTSRCSATSSCCRSSPSGRSSAGCSTSPGSRSSARRPPTRSTSRTAWTVWRRDRASSSWGAYSLMAFWQNKQVCADVLDPSVQAGCYAVRDPFDLAIVSASFVGALVGFLWWNAPKAKVFMGDCGSMAIGGVIAALAIFTAPSCCSC